MGTFGGKSSARAAMPASIDGPLVSEVDGKPSSCAARPASLVALPTAAVNAPLFAYSSKLFMCSLKEYEPVKLLSRVGEANDPKQLTKSHSLDPYKFQ